MATWYVRKTGLDTNAGTSAGAAFLTIQKALNSLASGDTVYVGAGVYREQVKFTGTAPTATTSMIADLDGFFTGDTGEVQITSYLTNDTTAASGTNPTIDLNAKNFFTWNGFTVIGSSLSTASCVNAASSVTNISFINCTFLNASNAANRPTISFGAQAADTNAAILFDRCLFGPTGGSTISFTVTRSATADFDCGLTVSNCLFLGGGGGPLNAQIILTTTGASTGGRPGGGYIKFCTFLSGGTGGSGAVRVANVWSFSIPARCINCYSMLDANVNVINGQTAGEGWDDGTIANGPSAGWFAGSIGQYNTYAPLFHLGQDAKWNVLLPRRMGEAPSGAPQLGFSPFSDVSVGVAGTTADDSTVGTVAWSSTDNAKIVQELAAEAYAATASLAQNAVSHYLRLTNWTFYPAVPTGATILGIRVEVNRKAVTSGTSIDWNSVALTKDGGTTYPHENVSSALPNNSGWATTADGQTQFGSSTDMWGFGAGGITPTDINSSNFGIGLSVTQTSTTAGTADIDGVRMFIYWKQPSTTSPVDITGRVRPSGGSSTSYACGAYERQDAATKQSGTVDASTYAGQITGPGTQRFRIPVKNVSTTISIKLRYDSTYDTTVSRPIVRLLESGEIGYAGQSITATTAALNAWETETFTAFTPTADYGVVWLEIQSFDANGGGKVFFDTENG